MTPSNPKSFLSEDDFAGDEFISGEVISCQRWIMSRWIHVLRRQHLPRDDFAWNEFISGEVISGQRWLHERWIHLGWSHLVAKMNSAKMKSSFGFHYVDFPGSVSGSERDPFRVGNVSIFGPRCSSKPLWFLNEMMEFGVGEGSRFGTVPAPVLVPFRGLNRDQS